VYCIKSGKRAKSEERIPTPILCQERPVFGGKKNQRGEGVFLIINPMGAEENIRRKDRKNTTRPGGIVGKEETYRGRVFPLSRQTAVHKIIKGQTGSYKEGLTVFTHC